MLKKNKKIMSAITVVSVVSGCLGAEGIYAVTDQRFNDSQNLTSTEPVIDLTGDNNTLTKIEYKSTTGSSVTVDKTDSITIEEARNISEGESATVYGVVSYVNGKSIYLQDDTAGINAYLKVKNTELKAGDYVKVTGANKIYNGLLELDGAELEIKEHKGIPDAKTLTVAELNTDKYQSQYIEIENAVIDTTAKTLTQGTDVINLDGVPAGSGTAYATGDKVNIKGTVGNYKGKVQLYAKSCTVEKVLTEAEKLINISHTPSETMNMRNDIKISVSIDSNNADKVLLKYKTLGSDKFTEVEMTEKSDGIYEGSISKDLLTLGKIEYSIYAENKYGNKETEIYTSNIVDEDNLGPEIFNITPKENSNVGTELRPEISAELKDEIGVDKTSIKVFFNNEDVTSSSTITETTIKYIPTTDLKDGSIYKVKIEASDLKGNINTKEWSFKKGEVNFQHLFGQLHAHTDISDGKGTLSEAYAWAKDKANADYFAVTDHSNWFDNDTSANIGDGSVSDKWVNAHNTADEYNKNDNFTAIYGYEMTWSGSTGGWGHINTFNTPGFETRTNSTMQDITKYYDALETQPQSISQFNHPGKTFGDFADFAYYNEERDKLINLVEVGNGEGAVRSSGYFPSYEYYTRALDKGWHLAPTNNQDNHKANWLTSNDARTVILADNNSRESIYDAMSEKRIYATEDKNMIIDFTVNDEQMGASLGEVDSLNFKINVKDPDSADKIKKISIIANGGTEVTSKTFDSNVVDWEFTLDPEYSYYYVKIVQDDKDIAVTAPVWVGEAVNVGMESLTTENGLNVTGGTTSLKTGIYNNTSDSLTNVKVDFFANEIKDGNKIGSTIIDTISASETKEAKFDWVPKKAGEYTIYAQTKINVNGKEKAFTNSIKIKVVEAEDTFKVVIDGAHYNQYTTGDYAGKYTAIKSVLENKNTLTVVNKDPITEETLKDVKILILTNPQSTDKNDLKASTFSDSEVDAIKKFVDNGGNLIVTTKADYGDGKGEYSNGAQMNKVLEAVGTELRINDDQVIDNTTNGGQAYRLYLTNYNSPKYNLVDGIKNGEDQYSFYSGASVILADGAKGDNVDFLVKGFDTTETSDSDKCNDNVAVPKGQVNVIGAEQLSSGGKVVVSGNTFFSDFEIDGTNGEKYSNIKVTKNIMNWMLPEKEIKTAKISELRKDDDNNGVPDLLGQEFVIEGRVTSQSEAIQPKNSFFEVIYIEDETGGLCVFGVSKTPLKVGQKVRITGKVDEYQGEFEIQLDNENEQLEVLDENTIEMKPTKLSTKDSMMAKNGGKLVQVQGKVVNMDDQNLYVDDGTGVSRAYVEGYVWDGIDENSKGKWDSSINIGDCVSIIGLASKDPEGGRLRVRNTSEIKKVTESNDDSDNNSGNENGNGNSGSTGNGGSGNSSSGSHHSSSHNSSSSKDESDNTSIKENTSKEESNNNSNSDTTKGWIQKGSEWTFVDENGSSKIGWIKDNDGKWYYLDNSGIMQRGWVKDSNETWYYLNNSGAMETGWIKDNDGKWYYLNDSGAMQTGWFLDNNAKWYYLNNSGEMRIGWIKDTNGKWYYLTENGSMAVDTVIDGYKVDETGAWVN